MQYRRNQLFTTNELINAARGLMQARDPVLDAAVLETIVKVNRRPAIKRTHHNNTGAVSLSTQSADNNNNSARHSQYSAYQSVSFEILIADLRERSRKVKSSSQRMNEFLPASQPNTKLN